MPPAAATECERTGWTLLMIATLAPICAAARAARWPASPAPMIKTSCAGMAFEVGWTEAGYGRRGGLGPRGEEGGLYNACPGGQRMPPAPQRARSPRGVPGAAGPASPPPAG